MNRRGQEEIVGFVIVVVLVAVIFLIFLGISVRQENKSAVKENKEIRQFLSSVMGHTSTCALNFEPNYVSMGGLVKECYEHNDAKCISGENACEFLKKTLKEMFKASWNIVNGSSTKGYIFKAEYGKNNLKAFIEISEGKCGNRFSGAEYLLPGFSEQIVSEFKLCY